MQYYEYKENHTTQYYPKGNPGPGQFNRTLLDMLGISDQERIDKGLEYTLYINYQSVSLCL